MCACPSGPKGLRMIVLVSLIILLREHIFSTIFHMVHPNIAICKFLIHYLAIEFTCATCVRTRNNSLAQLHNNTFPTAGACLLRAHLYIVISMARAVTIRYVILYIVDVRNEHQHSVKHAITPSLLLAHNALHSSSKDVNLMCYVQSVGYQEISGEYPPVQ